MNFKYSLGTKLKEKISGYEGVCIGRCDWLSKPNEYALQRRGLKEGEPYPQKWFPEDSLVEVQTGKQRSIKDRCPGKTIIGEVPTNNEKKDQNGQ